ncbi:MAG: hypothetical protein K6F64_01720 [Clostridia bacterium]|nr:hypothetical protein [Clostridia bacterium]
MKRIICFILSATIVFSCCVIISAAEDDTPVILVPGFVETVMGIDIDGENEEQLWPFTVPTVLGKIVSDSPTLMTLIAGLAFGKFDRLGARLGSDAEDVLHKLTCNPDGSSDYGIESFSQDPALCNVGYLARHKNGKYLAMADLAKSIAAKTDSGRTFVFCYNSQLDCLELASQLRSFVKSVKKYTGSKKVRLCSHSYGGQIIAAYFYRYLNDSDVEKAVMIYPALAGTDAIKHILEADADVPFDDILVFVENLLSLSTEAEKLLIKNYFHYIDEFASSGLAELAGMWRYWGSMYSLCSNEYYELLKKEFLDPVESAAIIKSNDIIHYDLIPNLRNTFKKCQAKGIDLSIISGSGMQECLGGDDNTDILLPTKLATGACCSKYGKHFSDGYKAQHSTCTDPKHSHVSPAMDIDASTAFLPENTWFVEGAFHGAYYNQEYSKNLIEKLILTDDIKDVYSDSDYPQFGYSDNVNMGIGFGFDKSRPGFLSSDDSEIVIKNLNNVTPIKILSVTASGLDIKFDAIKSVTVLPGKSVKIKYKGIIPKVKAKRTDITVKYVEGVSVNTLTRGFTVDNR